MTKGSNPNANIDVTTCAHCGSAVRIVASASDEAPQAIRAILDHFAKHGALAPAHCRPAARTARRTARCGHVTPPP